MSDVNEIIETGNELQKKKAEEWRYAQKKAAIIAQQMRELDVALENKREEIKRLEQELNDMVDRRQRDHIIQLADGFVWLPAQRTYVSFVEFD